MKHLPSPLGPSRPARAQKKNANGILLNAACGFKHRQLVYSDFRIFRLFVFFFVHFLFFDFSSFRVFAFSVRTARADRLFEFSFSRLRVFALHWRSSPNSRHTKYARTVYMYILYKLHKSFSLHSGLIIPRSGVGEVRY